jgi:predicted RNA-binding Zn-ribbon protein involved in translation (DUF1610 family)
MRCTKQTYLTKAHAEAEQKKVAAAFKKRGAGAQAKYLEAYQCPACGLWHIGRAWKGARRAANQFVKPSPPQKIPRAGDLRRKLERMQSAWERHDDYQRRQRAEALGRLIAAEQAIEDSKREYAKLQREILAMFFPE